MGILDSLLGAFGMDPAGAAQKYVEKIPGAVSPYYKPFIEEGEQARGQLTPQYEQMMQDPSAFINALMGQYEPSKGYQFQKEEMGQAAANTAAAGGFRGTPYDIEQQEKLTQGLLGQDMQQWLQNVLGVQQRGIAGEETGAQRGYEAGRGYGDILGQNLQTMGGLAGQQAQQRANIFGDIAKTIGGGLLL